MAFQLYSASVSILKIIAAKPYNVKSLFSKIAFWLCLGLLSITSSFTLAHDEKPCLAENGCLENMTTTYSVAAGSLIGYNFGDWLAYNYTDQAEAIGAVCPDMKAWEANYNTTHACHDVTMGCPVFDNHDQEYLVQYKIPVEQRNTCLNTVSNGEGNAATRQKSICETPPHIYPFQGFVHDAVAEQCWKCDESLRTKKQARFGRWAPDGTIIDSSNTYVTMFSPEACPVEREATDCELSSGVAEGNPVSCDSGAKTEVDTDYSVQGGDSLSFSRNYTSQPHIDEAGFGWGSNNDITFKLIQDESYSRVAEVGNGKFIHLYTGSGGATRLLSSTNAHGSVSLVDGAWTWSTAKGGKVVFGAGGKAVQKQGKGGVVNDYTWQEITGVGYVLESITSETGRQLNFTHNALGQMQTLTDPEGNVTTYEYDANGNLIKVIYPDDTPATLADNPFKRYHYEDPRFIHNLTGKTDENGDRHSTYAYDENGKGILTALANNAGKITFSYPEVGITEVERHVSETDSHKLTYHISKFHGASKITALVDQPCTDCVVGSTVREYDNIGRLTKIIHPDLTETLITQDANFRETRRIEAAGTPDARVVTRGWNNTWGAPSYITNNGQQTSFAYDGAGRVIRMFNTGAYTDYTYTEGNLTRIDGPLSTPTDYTDFTYDAMRNMESTTNALGHVTLFSDYDANGRVGKVVDPNGLTTTYTYTPRGWLETTNVNGRITTLTYDNVGQLKQVQSPSGQVVSYEYDAAHRLEAIIDGESNRLEYDLDYRGNRLQETIKNAAGVIVKQKSQRFNALSQLIEDINSANQIVGQYEYDVMGNVIEETIPTDAGNQETTYGYDALNRLTDITDALNGVTEFTFNPRDELITVEDAENLSTAYDTNTQGRVDTLTSPDTGITTFTYDPAGNIKTKTDARGIITTYTYDGLSRLKTISYPDASENIVYSYDDTTNGNNGIGRLTSVIDSSGATEYEYNVFGQMTKETRTIESHTYVTEYVFDTTGQLDYIIYPNGQTLSYSYNTLGQINSLSATDQTGTTLLANNISYLPFGPMKDLVYGNGNTLTQTFDKDYRLSNKSTTFIGDLTYGYDLANNITDITSAANAEQSQVFNYDVLSRLTTGSGDYGDVGYTYDAVGNRQTKDTDTGSSTNVETYGYATSSHRVESITQTNTTELNLSYDEVGNTLTKGELTFTYNQQNRMETVSRAGMNATYLYNAKGERVSKTVNGVSTHFIYNLQGQLIAEVDAASGDIQKQYYFLNGQPYAMQAQSLSAEEILFDNTDALFTGNWQNSTSVSGYTESNYAYHAANGATSNGVVIDNNEAALIGNWQSSTSVAGYWGGEYTYASPNQTNAGGIITDSESIDATLTGNWNTSTSVAGFNGSHYWPGAQGAGEKQVSWGFPSISSGEYNVYARWTAHANRASNANYQINSTTGTSSIMVDQRVNGAAWNLLGTYSLNNSASITLSNDTDGWVIADAIMIVPTDAQPNAAIWEWQADQTDTYTVNARWTAHANRATNATYQITSTGGFAQPVMVNQTQNGNSWNELTTLTLNQGDILTVSLSDEADGYVIADAIQIVPLSASANGNTAEWFLTTINAEEYKVYANWTAHANRASNATFKINTTTTTESVTVDQTQNGGSWQLLGTYFLDDQSSISVSDQANGYVIADGVRLVPVNPIATNEEKAFYYYHNDHLGTPKALTDENGQVQWQATHTPFGLADITVSNIEQNVRFPGQYFDGETGLHYNYFRDYDPGTGRYLQSDPIGLGGGINTYGYALQNPMGYTDFYGLEVAGQWQVVPNLSGRVTDFNISDGPDGITTSLTFEAIIAWEILCTDDCTNESWAIKSSVTKRSTVSKTTFYLPGCGKGYGAGGVFGAAIKRAKVWCSIADTLHKGLSFHPMAMGVVEGHNAYVKFLRRSLIPTKLCRASRGIK